MGIYTSSYMLVGVPYRELPTEIKDKGKGLYEYIEENGLDIMSIYYDCDIEYTIIGSTVENMIDILNIDIWVKQIKEVALEIEQILKVKPKLIATHNIS